jgi:hypothetical protein
MAWSDQQYQAPQQVPQNMPPGMSANSVPPAGGTGGVPAPGYYGANPLQAQAMLPTAAMPPAGQYPAASNPLAQAPLPAAGMPPLAAQPALAGPMPSDAAGMDNDTVAVDDLEWVNRAKRVIAGTKGDPHRQVQLVQHLRSQYLKHRFGRTVHTDEG